MKKCIRTNQSSSNYNNDDNRNRRRSRPSRILTFPAGVVTSLFLLSSIITSNGLAHATASTLTLNLGSDTTTVNVAPMSSNGSFNKSSNTTISAYTNNYTGYTLSIAATNATDYDKLKNSSNTACNNTGNNSNSINGKVSTNCLHSINTPTSESTFSGLNNTGYNGLWGYLPSKYCTGNTSSSCANNTDFRPAPNTTGNTLDITSAANANNTSNSYSLAIGTRIDSTIAIDSYTNTYEVRLVGNAIPYTITYDDNVVSNMPTDVSGEAANSTVAIENTTPTRSGYRFLGWCTVAPTSSSDGDTCTGGTTYQPGANLTISQTGGNNNFQLYAMWAKETQSSCFTSPKISTAASGITYMQDINSANRATVLAALTQDATYQIKDNRDDETYCVSKLADGNLWLLDNLALDLTNSDILNSLSSTNTNIDSNNETVILTSLKSGNRSAGNQYATSGVADYASSNSYSDPLVNLAYKDTISSDAADQAGGYKIGGYYNYCAASAGSYCYGDGTTSTGSPSGNATSSICPAGWRLPGGSGNINLAANPPTGEYKNLYNNAGYNTYAVYRAALHLPLSGFFGPQVGNQGYYGCWWSSTYDYNTTMSTLDISSTYTSPDNYSNRGQAHSVRCVLNS